MKYTPLSGAARESRAGSGRKCSTKGIAADLSEIVEMLVVIRGHNLAAEEVG